MRQTIKRSISLVGIMLVTVGLAMGAPKTERAKSEINIHGRVLKVDKKERTLLISDHWSKKLYLVTIPDGAKFKVFFGLSRSFDYPTLDRVYKGDIIRARCIRSDKQHFASLDDGRQVMVLTVAR